jgi:hypothetical protein
MILDSKMRYAHKGTPKERGKEKIKEFEGPTDEEDELEITEEREKKQKARGSCVGSPEGAQ